MPVDEQLHGFRKVPDTGVIYASNEAARHGWKAGDPAWSNLGQGQSETGPLPGAPPRVKHINIDPTDHKYGPVAGLTEFREAVAAFYNGLFRRGLPSQYTVENVAIASGGRTALTRAVASLGELNLGHFLPDYTAYEELLDSFRLVKPTSIPLSREKSYEFNTEDLRRKVIGQGLGAVLLSNPCNPMGRLIAGYQLREWIEVARKHGCALLLDEFYSHYIWNKPKEEPEPIVSAARWVENVNRDPVIIFDGLTKNWRYPGWRISWTVGPREIIKSIQSAGSFLDGGPPRPMQRAALGLLDIKDTLQETRAIQAAFRPKRELVLQRCLDLGLTVDREPDGGFYVFASLRDLPEPLSDSNAFFTAALAEKLITVPGIFFDINPGRSRPLANSRFGQDVRISFGPTMETVCQGMQQLSSIIRNT